MSRKLEQEGGQVLKGNQRSQSLAAAGISFKSLLMLASHIDLALQSGDDDEYNKASIRERNVSFLSAVERCDGCFLLRLSLRPSSRTLWLSGKFSYYLAQDRMTRPTAPFELYVWGAVKEGYYLTIRGFIGGCKNWSTRVDLHPTGDRLDLGVINMKSQKLVGDGCRHHTFG